MSVTVATVVDHVVGEILDYSIDWANVLVVGETIGSSSWTVISGTALLGNSLTDGSPSTTKNGTITTYLTTVGLLSATAGQTIQLMNTMVTSVSRQYIQAVSIRIVAVI